jgi:hypothetical protein
MKITISNGTEHLSIAFEDFCRDSAADAEEYWLDGTVDVLCNRLSYRYLISFQANDVSSFAGEMEDLLNCRRKTASFSCLEEWLSIDISAQDSLGHYNVAFEIRDHETEIKSSFTIAFNDLKNARRDMPDHRVAAQGKL